MPDRQHLYIFWYDISKDYDRDQLAGLLEDHLVRVQLSVFEGFLTSDRADRLALACCRFLGGQDSLRVYVVTTAG